MNNNEANMFEELFIDLENNGDYMMPPEPKEHYLKIVNSNGDVSEKAQALLALIACYRFETFDHAGKLGRDAVEKIIEIVHSAKRTLGDEHVAALFIQQGGRSESFRDYESALMFYEASLRYEAKDSLARYLRLNNTGFCLNFFRRFREAEEYLKEAVFIKPLRYNAWKNLGVSLEHLGEIDRAAECYVQAMYCSNSEQRSSAHFRRLLDRYPVLSKTYTKIQSGKKEE